MILTTEAIMALMRCMGGIDFHNLLDGMDDHRKMRGCSGSVVSGDGWVYKDCADAAEAHGCTEDEVARACVDYTQRAGGVRWACQY